MMSLDRRVFLRISGMGALAASQFPVGRWTMPPGRAPNILLPVGGFGIGSTVGTAGLSNGIYLYWLQTEGAYRTRALVVQNLGLRKR